MVSVCVAAMANNFSVAGFLEAVCLIHAQSSPLAVLN